MKRYSIKEIMALSKEKIAELLCYAQEYEGVSHTIEKEREKLEKDRD